MAGTNQGSGTKQHPKPVQVAPHDPYGHGHSVAAWSAVGIVMLGSLLACLGVGFGWDYLWLVIVGAVIIVLGPIVGKVLGAMGFGSKNRSAR